MKKKGVDRRRDSKSGRGEAMKIREWFWKKVWTDKVNAIVFLGMVVFSVVGVHYFAFFAPDEVVAQTSFSRYFMQMMATLLWIGGGSIVLGLIVSRSRTQPGGGDDEARDELRHRTFAGDSSPPQQPPSTSGDGE